MTKPQRHCHSYHRQSGRRDYPHHEWVTIALHPWPESSPLPIDGQTRQIRLGIGGYVRATGEYDFGGIVDDIDFVPANIPSSSKIKNQFQMDASTATIFLKLVGHTRLLGDFTVYTAGNFRGGDKNIPATECLYVIPKYNGGIYLRRFHGLRRPPLHHWLPGAQRCHVLPRYTIVIYL